MGERVVSCAVAGTALPKCGAKDLMNTDKDCWNHCNKTQGPCSWCGTKGMCCTTKSGWTDTSNGCDGTFGGSNFHACALMPVQECQERTKAQNCYEIRDRGTCLVTNDPRTDYAGPCGWCGDKCGNDNVCEPVVWLKGNSNTNYEDCLQPGENFKILLCNLVYQISHYI